MSELEKAVQEAQQAMGLAPVSRLSRYLDVDGIGEWLISWYRERKARQAIRDLGFFETDIIEPSLNDADLGGAMNRFLKDTRERQSRAMKERDIDEDIRAANRTLEKTPPDHRDRVYCLNDLGDILGCRYLIKGAESDMQSAVSYHREAMHLHTGSVGRISAGRAILIWCAATRNWSEAYEASATALRLAPLASPLNLSNPDRQYVIRVIGGFASDAAAAAINANQGSLSAIELIELGRYVLAGSINDIRRDFSSLKEKEPELVQQLVSIRHHLDSPLIKLDPSMADQDPSTIERLEEIDRQISQKKGAAQKLDELLPQIRKEPGFEDFLLPPSGDSIRAAASCGPIVIINVSRYRCDALIVERDQQPRIIKLPNLSEEETHVKARELVSALPQVLEWLWDTLTEPILNALGFTGAPDEKNWPRIWWIPTGLLSKFPLHAAGYHLDGSLRTVLDRVISSYSSSIKSILHHRRRHAVTSSTPGKVLLVSMSDTVDQAQLPFAAKEVEAVRDRCKSMGYEPVEPKRCKIEVLSHLRNCKIFHFAGHGYTDEADPARSSLVLEDWNISPLKVSNLFQIDLHETAPFLAFLSACGTGRIKEERSLDESTHLITGFQISGFRHVIGTLWGVRDQICVEIADIAYNFIAERGISDESVSEGLHQAIRELRSRWLKSNAVSKQSGLTIQAPGDRTRVENVISSTIDAEPAQMRDLRDVELCDDYLVPLVWVPYVHYGV